MNESCEVKFAGQIAATGVNGMMKPPPEWIDWGADDYVRDPPPVLSIVLGSVCIVLGILAIILLLESVW